MFNTLPSTTLHDALADVHVLRDAFRQLLQKNIITVTKHAPDMMIHARDVAIVVGMMTQFHKHPADVAQRVLTHSAAKLGVVLSAELECARTLSVLGKRKHVEETNTAETAASPFFCLIGGSVNTPKGERKTWGFCGNANVVQGIHLPPHERVELEVVMRANNTNSPHVHQDKQLWEFIVVQCHDFFYKVLRLIETQDLWMQWNRLTCTQEERRNVWECL
jgi:hypothetical protein